jgi:hypothetical protein
MDTFYDITLHLTDGSGTREFTERGVQETLDILRTQGFSLTAEQLGQSGELTDDNGYRVSWVTSPAARSH